MNSILLCLFSCSSKGKVEVSWNAASEHCALHNATLPMLNSFEDVEMLFDRLRVFAQPGRNANFEMQDGHRVIQFVIFLYRPPVKVWILSELLLRD